MTSEKFTLWGILRVLIQTRLIIYIVQNSHNNFFKVTPQNYGYKSFSGK